MKKTLALVMAVLLVVALFAGCGGTGSTNTGSNGNAGANTGSTSTGGTNTGNTGNAGSTGTDTGAPDAGGSTPAADNSPYNFAAGKYEVTAAGLPATKYNYTLPLTTTDETLTFWTCSYTPEWLETDYQESPYPVQMENLTGVHVEYQLIPAAQRSTNFSVLLAADELPDIMSQANYYYPNSFKAGILEEEYFVNLYDYRDYMPNYLYEVGRSPQDESLQNAVYMEKDLIGAFYTIRDKEYVQNGIVVRGDWLQTLNMTQEMFTTWEGTHECLLAFKSQIPTATYPITLFQTLESGGYHWNCFDTYCYLSTGGMMMLVDENGQVFAANTTYRDQNLMTELSKWYSEGLIDPMWSAWSAMTSDGWMNRWVNDQIGYSVQATSTALDQDSVLDIEGTHFLPLADPVLYEGQKLHVGTRDSRLYYGNAVIGTRCQNIELAVTWLDWRYSDEGGEFCTRGAEGYGWEYNENGEKRVTEFIRSNPAYTYSMHILCYALNTLCDPGLDYNYMHFQYDGGDAVLDYYDYFADAKAKNFDGAFLIPSAVELTDEESAELLSFSNDLTTFITENYLLFLDGSRPMSDWDKYESDLNTVGRLQEYLAVYQGAYDRYLANA